VSGSSAGAPGAPGAPDAPGAAERIVEKPWGRERIWAETERYVGKVITIKPGERLSLQAHRVKDESLLVLRGRLRLHIGPDQASLSTVDLGPGEHRRVPTGQVHRFEALDQEVELVEVSTPELDDVIRLEDDYGREGTSAP
jgi:mannose-6-phosphate isomerase